MTAYQILRADLAAASDAFHEASTEAMAARNAATTYAHYFAALRLGDAANAAHDEAVAAARATFAAARAIIDAANATP